MKNTLSLFLFLSFFTLSSNAQEDYIQDFTGKINTKLKLETNLYSYKIRNLSDNSYYDIRSNESEKMSASVQFKFIAISVGFTPSFLSNNNDEYLRGASDINSISLNIFYKQFTQLLDYNQIKGFYIENTGDFEDNWVEGKDPYLILNDVKLERYSGKTIYSLNKNFSLKALLAQNEKQLKSVGSFIPSISYAYSRINNASETIIGNDERSFDFNINAGYIYNFVFGKSNNYFASLSISPGMGLKFSKIYETNTSDVAEDSDETYLNFNLAGRLNLGYNSNSFFGGLQINGLSTSYDKNPETRIEDTNSFFQLYFGYRFKAPKKLRKLFNMSTED